MISSPRRPRTLQALLGLVAGFVALGVAEVVAAFVTPTSSPVVAVGGVVVDSVPSWLKELAIRSFGTADKAVLITTVIVVVALYAGTVGILAHRDLTWGLLGVALFALLGAAAAYSRPLAGVYDVLPSLVGGGSGAVALRLLVTGSVRPSAPPQVGAGTVDRRQVLRTALGLTAGAALAGLVGRRINASRGDVLASRDDVLLPPSTPTPLPEGTDLGVEGVAPYLTGTSEFYRIDTALLVPRITTDEWRLRVTGLVEHPFELTFEELLAMPTIERTMTLACVSNEVGGDLVGNARWLGVPLAAVLSRAGVKDGADQLLMRSSDGWSCGAPSAVVLDGRDAMLAVGMNGEPLPVEHGFPVRAVVPGLYGYVSACKWITSLELTTFAEVDAYWVRRGWARRAPVKTMTRIDTPRGGVPAGRTAVAGVAWAMHRGIDEVQVRVDGGPWSSARLAATAGVDTWRQWVWEWDANKGSHLLEVRSVDGTGQVQTGERAEPIPDGASGWHSVRVQIS